VSTILDAQRELESRGAAFPPQPPRHDPNLPWGFIALACVALGAVALGFLWLRTGRQAPEAVATAPASSPSTRAASAPAAPHPDDRAEKQPVGHVMDKPQGRALPKSPGAALGGRDEASAPTTAAAPQVAPLAPRVGHDRPLRRPEKGKPAVASNAPQRVRPDPPPAARVAPVEPPAPPPPAPAPESPSSASSGGEPRVEVKSIAYAKGRSMRAVTLQIDGARPVTLHEGESAGGVEVQLILPETIYLRHGANIYAVGRPLRLQ